MRVLVVTSQFPLPGDLQRGRAVHQTVLHLSRIASVSVLSPVATYPSWLRPRSYTYRAAPAGFDAGVPVKYLAYRVLPGISRPLNGWLCARVLVHDMQRVRPDVVLAYWLYPDAYAALAVARRLGIPVVAGARGSDLRTRDPVSRRLARTVVREADRLLVVSQDLARIAVARDGAAADRVRVIPNGCDSAIFRLQDQALVRARLGVPPDAKLALYVGRLVPEKGLRELLAAMTILRDAGKTLQLAIAGDGPMRAEIGGLVRNAGLDQVLLLGALDPRTVSDWMAAADLVVLPSYSEGHPNVLIEALACGRPFVATPVGGIVEVADPACSILVPPRDAAALARGIAAALDRDWNGAELARRHDRGWEVVAKQTLDACTEALQARAAAQ